MSTSFTVTDKRRFTPERLETPHIIPPIMDPLGRHWDQPKTSEILIDDTHAIMTRRTFDSLKEYSCTNPTGVYPGKMWKRHDGVFDYEFLASGGKPVWQLRWYGESEKGPEWCSNHSRDILIV